jgi:hypothetical protein
VGGNGRTQLPAEKVVAHKGIRAEDGLFGYHSPLMNFASVDAVQPAVDEASL